MGIIKHGLRYDDQQEVDLVLSHPKSSPRRTSILKGVAQISEVIQVSRQKFSTSKANRATIQGVDAAVSSQLRENVIGSSDKSSMEAAYEDGFQAGLAQGFSQGQVTGLEEGKVQGIEEGRSQMLEEAMDVANQKWETYSYEFATLLNDIKIQSNDINKMAEKSLIDLVCQTAEKVIRRTIDADSTVITDMISEELLALNADGKATIRVHPDLAQQLREQLPKIKEKFTAYADIFLQEDKTLEPGACILETNSGYVDLSVRTSINLITDLFKQVYQRDSTKKQDSSS